MGPKYSRRVSIMFMTLPSLSSSQFLDLYLHYYFVLETIRKCSCLGCLKREGAIRVERYYLLVGQKKYGELRDSSTLLFLPTIQKKYTNPAPTQESTKTEEYMLCREFVANGYTVCCFYGPSTMGNRNNFIKQNFLCNGIYFKGVLHCLWRKSFFKLVSLKNKDQELCIQFAKVL